MKKKLSYKPEYNFTLIGVSSRENDFKVSWAINKKLSFNFTRDKEDFVLKEQKEQAPQMSLFDFAQDSNSSTTNNTQKFSVYSFESEKEALCFTLISNKGESGYLIPEQNYFIEIDGETTDKYLQTLIKSLNEIDVILTARTIDLKKLKAKNKQKLIVK